jgi:hypothetical protein
VHPVSGTTPGASVNLGHRNKLDFGKNFCALLVNLCVALTRSCCTTRFPPFGINDLGRLCNGL